MSGPTDPLTATGPVEELAIEIARYRRGVPDGPVFPTDADRAVARRGLTKVWSQDWRIVRLDVAEDETTCEILEEWDPILGADL